MVDYLASRPGAIREAEDAVAYARALIQQRGDVAVAEDLLLVGRIALNNTTEIVDEVKANYGFGCTIFLGNVRIATTAVAAHTTERAVGTTANAKVTQAVYRRGEPFRGVTRTIGKNWVIVYQPLRDHQGKIVGMIAAYRELNYFLHSLELLVDVTAPLILHTEDGQIVDANQAACDMSSMSKHGMLERSISAFVAPASLPEITATWRHVGEEPSLVETHWRRADGFSFPVELSVERPNLSEPLLLCIARDVTEGYAARERLRRLNAELRHANSALETKIDIRTAELQHAMQLASAIQSGFLPRSPTYRVNGSALSGFYRPAEHCGGDWWWYERHGDSLLVAVGDVTGHGIGSAMVTAAVAGVFRAFEGHEGVDIDNRFERVSREVERATRGSLLFAMTAVTINSRTGEYCVHSCGGPPPFVVQREQACGRAIVARGNPLGSGPPLIGKSAGRFDPHERLALFSDGLPELSIRHKRQFGMRRFMRLLESSSNLTVEDAVRATVGAASEQLVGAQQDDWTLVLVDWAEHGSTEDDA